MKIYFENLNMCPMRRVNIYHYKNALLSSNHSEVLSPDDADIILVWTCAFREDMNTNSVNKLNMYQRQGKKTVIAGCLPSISPDKVSEFKGNIIHFNNSIDEFMDAFGIDLTKFDYPICEHPIETPIEEFRKNNPDKKVVWDDQYIKLFIQEGCTRKCSYCTEIQAFPKYKSYDFDKILDTASRISKKYNKYDIAIQGDDIGAYGMDCGSSLPKLIDALLDLDPRIRLSLKQINPYYMKMHMDKIYPYILSGRIFQILIPIQSANDRILGLMERGYNRSDLEYIFGRFNETEVEIETHLIAGFPSESDSEWMESVDFLCSYKNVRYVMGNPFMPGVGTKAAEMQGQVSEETKKERIISGEQILNHHGTVVGHSYNQNGITHITKKKLEMIEY